MHFRDDAPRLKLLRRNPLDRPTLFFRIAVLTSYTIHGCTKGLDAFPPLGKVHHQNCGPRSERPVRASSHHLPPPAKSTLPKFNKARFRIEKKLTREQRTELQNEISDIQELRDEYKQLLQTILSYEKSKKQKDNEKIAELLKDMGGGGTLAFQ